MNRSDAITYLSGRFDAIIEALHIRPDDSARGLGSSVDGAFRELGVVTNAEVPEADTQKLNSLLRAHFLAHALERAAVLVDITADDPQVNARRSQMFTQLQSAYTLARSDADLAMADPQADQMSLFRLNLDYIQDTPVEA